jgi:hypothetical protein
MILCWWVEFDLRILLSAEKTVYSENVGVTFLSEPVVESHNAISAASHGSTSDIRLFT